MPKNDERENERLINNIERRLVEKRDDYVPLV